MENQLKSFFKKLQREQQRTQRWPCANDFFFSTGNGCHDKNIKQSWSKLTVNFNQTDKQYNLVGYFSQTHLTFFLNILILLNFIKLYQYFFNYPLFIVCCCKSPERKMENRLNHWLNVAKNYRENRNGHRDDLVPVVFISTVNG